MSDTTLRDAIVVVTGASKGIGLATARAFAEAGAHVVLLARSRERVEAEAATIGDRATAITCDVGKPDDVRAAFEEIDNKFDRLDVLVNNAGVAVLSSIEESTDEDIARSVGTNLLGPIYTTRAAIGMFKRRGRGDIINISSESTMFPFPYLGLYAATKAGLETFTKATLNEVKPLGIRVTVVLCGSTMTEFGTDWDPEVAGRFFAAAQESGHLAMASAGQPMDPADVADALVFIATRPENQIVDVMHVRSHNNADSHGLAARAADRSAESSEGA